MPIDLPSGLLNRFVARGFNSAYYRRHGGRSRKRVSMDPFFYPLDALQDWNRLYGRRGFLQYQCVVPEMQPLREILGRIADSGMASFLAVLKTFGGVRSPGRMSFPRPGLTLALDFANQGAAVFRLLEDLDAIVAEAGGAVYPAKDARMRPDRFRQYFPQWEEFAGYVDPSFSSSFWRRVTAGAPRAAAIALEPELDMAAMELDAT